MTIKTTINKGNFPVHIWTDEVESTAYEQLIQLSQFPYIHNHIAVMPDVHAGRGSTVGTVIATTKAVIPAAVGVDIGCGMCAVPTNLNASDLPDSLKGLRDAIELAVPVGFGAHADSDHLRHHPAGNFMQSKKTQQMRELMDKYSIEDPKQTSGAQLGTLGGGNHFIEVCLDESDKVWIVLHSGSRGIGNQIGKRFMSIARDEMQGREVKLPNGDLSYLEEGSDHFRDYVFAVQWGQEYAAYNRLMMLDLVIRVMKCFFPQMVAYKEERAINCHHNYISKEFHFGEECYVTRKGAVHAGEGVLGIIPGSMGAKSFIVEGKGNDQSFHSCSHGAGRRMSRGEAKRTFTLADHEQATHGVECRKDEGVLDETPACYKDIDQVMANQDDLVSIKHTLKQVLCVKG